MINNSRLIAIIPARGGSKGIKKKNLIEIEGVSLVERAFRLAKRNKNIDKIYVSTDDPEIYALSQELGIATPKPRPDLLASDSARTVDLIKNLLDEAVINIKDCVILMQPTTPLRTSIDLNNVISMFTINWDNTDAVISLVEINGPHPYKAQILEDSKIKPLMGIDSSVPRQSLPKVYLPNGAFYLIKVRALIEENTFMPVRSLPYIMSEISSINLDSPLDLMLLEAAISRGLGLQALTDSN